MQTSHNLVSNRPRTDQSPASLQNYPRSTTIRSVKLNLRPTIPVQLENQPNNKFTAYKSVQIDIQLTSITIRAYKSVWLENQPQSTNQAYNIILVRELDATTTNQAYKIIIDRDLDATTTNQAYKSSQLENQMPQQPIRPTSQD